jgi:hypothetical protein
LLPAQERRLNQIPDDQLEAHLGAHFEVGDFEQPTDATMEWTSARRHCNLTEGKTVTVICLVSSAIGKAISRCSGRGPALESGRWRSSYAIDSWSQITRSRAQPSP